VDVTMPQLGETVTEGTITKWFKQVGDKVAADEPLFEVSTDKVDSEVPAPEAGYLSAIVVPEGETVPVGAKLAVISSEAGAASAPAAVPSAPAAAQPAPTPAPAPAPAPAAAPPVAPAPVHTPAPVATAPAANGDVLVTSPVVRRLIAEEGLDASQVRGTGEGGRITRGDVLDVIVQEVDKARGRIGLKLIQKHENGGTVSPEELIERAKNAPPREREDDRPPRDGDRRRGGRGRGRGGDRERSSRE